MVNIDEINESISKFGAVVDGLSKLDDTYAKVDETNASAKKKCRNAAVPAKRYCTCTKPRGSIRSISVSHHRAISPQARMIQPASPQ